MSIVKCPECGHEISDKAKHCVHCGCPIKIKQPKTKTKKFKFFIIPTICIVFCLIFLVMFLLTTNNTRTLYFLNNQYYLIARDKIGSSEMRENLDNNLVYHHSLNEDDDVFLEIYDLKYSYNFRYSLTNAEIKINLFTSNATFVKYKMTENGVVIEDSTNADEYTIKLAETMKNLLDTIVNIDLDGACTIDDILIEYYNYCNSIASIKIAGIVLASLFFVAFCVSFALSFIKYKSSLKSNDLSNSEIKEEN